jgi:type III pantothenate kinase
MILAIDAGNSRVKWGGFANGDWIATGAAAHRELQLLTRAMAGMPSPEKIVISNVAGERVRRSLLELLANAPVSPEWVASERERCGVRNGYADPAKLGSDRWAALIAAHRLQLGPVLVVNAGTALTVDAITQRGEFLGGLIVPGIALMMQALTTGTAHAHARQGEFARFPVNTLDAIYSGAINATVGSIERMSAALSARTGTPAHYIVSGGAAAALMPHLDPQTIEVKHLVLQGLVTIAESTK